MSRGVGCATDRVGVAVGAAKSDPPLLSWSRLLGYSILHSPTPTVSNRILLYFRLMSLSPTKTPPISDL